MKVKKISIICMLIVAILISFTCNVNATINPDNFKPGNLTASDYNKPFQFAGTILNAIWVVGIVIAVVAVIVLGLKYMMGSLEERAEYKKNMLPIIIGIVILVSSTTIVSMIYNFMLNVK